MKRSLLIAAFAFASACGNNTEPPENSGTTSADAVTYHGDIAPIVDAYCVRCHDAGGIGPFALTTYEEVAAVGALVVSNVENRSMPPFLAAPAPRALKFDTSLSDAQIATFRSWLDAGMPAGSPENAGEALNLTLRELSRTDLTIAMPTAYTPTDGPDDYRCFVIDWPEQDVKYVTGMNLRPGNLRTAHHAVPYLIDPDFADLVDAADGADGRPGYSCFGGATPPGVDSFPTKIISAWTPGEFGQDFPPGTGVRVDPGSRIVLQMHYSIVEAGPESDLTEVDFSLADTVEKQAGNLPWLDLEWPNNPTSMAIPAGSETTHEYVGEPGQFALLGSFIPGLDPSEGVVIHSILPHLHKLGKRIWFEVERTDGSVERILDIQKWDFNWQGYYEFAEPITMPPGDKLRIHCEWDNTMNNQPLINGERRAPTDVTWGEGTYDEMCAASVFVHGIASGSTECAEFRSTPSDTGKFLVTFDATPVRGNTNLDGELVGPIFGSVYRAEDVRLTGPVDGAQPVGVFDFPDIDLRTDTAGPFLLDFELPAGDYQFLGFMDIDANVDSTGEPDLNDPIMIPARPTTLSCAEQPVTISFPILLPNL